MSLVPDYIAPMVGYRKWAVAANGLLTGVAARQPWAPKRPFAATCSGADNLTTARVEGHWDGHRQVFVDAPVRSCSCGVYAAKTLDAARNVVGSGGVAAWGEVWLWGRIIDHEKGYRAQFAYPKALTMYDDPELAALVAERYGVPVAQVSKPRENAWDGWSTLYGQGLSYSTPIHRYYTLSPRYITIPSNPISPVTHWFAGVDFADDDDNSTLIWQPKDADAAKSPVLRPEKKDLTGLSDEAAERLYRYVLHRHSRVPGAA